MPFAVIRQQRLTLKQFKEAFDVYLEAEPELEDAVIVDARMIDDVRTLNDGAIVFDCWVQEGDKIGTFMVPVIRAVNVQ